MKYEGINRDHDVATSLNINQKKAIKLLRQVLNTTEYKDTAVQLLTHGVKQSLKKSKEIVLMLKILPKPSVEEKLIAEEDIEENEPWLNDESIPPKISGLWRLFMEFADTNKADKDSAFVIEVNTYESDFVSVLAQTKAEVF